MDDPRETVKARALWAQLEAKELNCNAGEVTGGVGMPGCGNNSIELPQPVNHKRYKDGWQWLAFWLQEKHYHSPRAITYRNAIEYIDWRTGYRKRPARRLDEIPPSWN